MEFSYVPFQNADMLGAYLRGQMAPLQQAQAQQDYQLGQYKLQEAPLQLDQLRLMLNRQNIENNILQGAFGGQQSGAQNGVAAPTDSAGVINGPQGSVTAPRQASGSYNGANEDQLPLDRFTNQQLTALGVAAPDMLKGVQAANDAAYARRKLETSDQLANIQAAKGTENPVATMLANQVYRDHWPQYAARLGLDPLDPKSMTPNNVRAAFTLAENDLHAYRGEPAEAMPELLHNVSVGNEGEIAQVNQYGKKVGDLQERQAPVAVGDRYDPSTNTTQKIYHQFLGGAPGGDTSIDLGMKAPDDQNLKAAMFASEMRSGMNTLSDLESGGFNLSPKTRALVIHAATSEDSGLLAQLVAQGSLVYGLSPKEQTYISALMPMLQAAGHDQSGARLTTAQIRQNVESLLPVDVSNKKALAQVQENRQGFYTGLLTQAGSAAQLPQYKNSLGADLSTAQNVAQRQDTKVINGTTYYKQNGKWYAQ